MTGAVERHWFEDLADHMGPAYLRYSFTKGTVAEVDALVDLLGLSPGMSVLDVGCGPGRHAIELAGRGISVVGVDISSRFVEVASGEAERLGVDARFLRCDARALPFADRFDAAISLCQGAFGLGGPGPFAGDPQNFGSDRAVLEGIRRALRPGGRCAVTAFSSYFQVRHLEEHDRFDAATGVNHEPTEVRDERGSPRPADLWTTCYTPRELHLLATIAGLRVESIGSVTPGRYRQAAATIDQPEFLLIASRPGESSGSRPPVVT
ncbi:MAG: class I SAM-dependent methyltransferase [Microthrixaceae bacterium]